MIEEASDVTVSGGAGSIGAADSFTLIPPNGKLIDVWMGDSGDNVSRYGGSPLSEETVITEKSLYFHSELHTHIFDKQVVSDAYKASDATCTEPAIYYKSCVCGEKTTETFTNGTAIGHAWGKPVFDWSEDGKSCMATFACENDPAHTVTEEAAIQSEVKTDAVCTEMGVTLYTATVKFEGQTYTDAKEVTDIAETGHAWGEPVFDWSKDGKTCTATFICENDPAHTVIEEAAIQSEVKTDAVCTEMGVTLYTATVEFEGQTYTDAKEVTDIAETGHAWGKPVFDWSEDGKSCMATFACENDPAHTVTEEAAIQSEVKTDAVCTEMGVTLYTATVEFEGQTYTDTKEVTDIAETGHAWGKPVFDWSEDGKSCTAARVCENDPAHVETTEATVTGEQTKAPDCTEKGENTYTAVFTEEWAETQTKTIADIDATGHTYGDSWESDETNHWHECICGDRMNVAEHEFVWVITKEAEVGVVGEKHEECEICGYEKAPVEIPAMTDSDGENPSTGDNSYLTLWIALLLVSSGVLGTLMIKRKKQER